MTPLKQLIRIALLASITAVGALAQAADMADGEVRKIDKEQKTITLKHGEIKSIDMPGMTMVFKLKDPTMADTLKPGDKVKFAVEKVGSALVVTEISVAN